MKKLLYFLMLIFLFSSFAQESKQTPLPYESIPDAPTDYGPGNVIARMIDGLGYRYYWATEGLTEKDLQFSPSKDARTLLETLQHVYGLSETILNASDSTPNVRPQDWSDLSFQELRKGTLVQLQKASERFLGKTADEIEAMKVIFKRGEKAYGFPYWNMLNGQLSDAIYHTGQVVSFRRASGNPLHPKVNVFIGKTGK